MFLLNSRLDLFAAPSQRRDPFSLSYGVNLPSSLTVNLSSALVYSTRPRVSVYGTGLHTICLADFLGSLITTAIRLPGGARYYRASAQPADLPTGRIPLRFNALFRQCADVSLLRRHIALLKGNGIFTVCPSAAPYGFALGPDLP